MHYPTILFCLLYGTAIQFRNLSSPNPVQFSLIVDKI